MMSADLVISGCRAVATCRGPLPKRGRDLGDVGLVENGCVAASMGRIVYAGPEDGLEKQVRIDDDAVHIDGRGFIALPGFVDAHTHLPFGGDRQDEFRLRLAGATYQELAARGMGIRTTVKATRDISRDELLALCGERLDRMLLSGTTTLEAKSGYGLNLEDEIKQLEVLRELDRTHPVDIVPTFMGAHDIPPEFKEKRGEYIDFLVGTVLPEVKRRGLAEFFDIFCEEGVFTLEETRTLVGAAGRAGLGIKIHSDEFVPLGATELAAEAGARSAEHLIAVTPEGIAALAGSRTAAVLLPGVSFFLRMDKRAPARRLIEAGAAVVLASDFNPGSSMVSSMAFVLQLGVFTLGMSVEEALNACTANAAYAVGREREVGSLEPGKKADILLCRGRDHISLAYEVGTNPVRHVIKNGRIVVRDGSLLPSR